MPSPRRRRGGPAISPVLPLLLATSLLLGGLVALGSGLPQPAAAVPAAQTSAVTDVDGFETSAPAPVGVRSEAVGIASPTIPLGKRDDGRLEVPQDAHTAGWWTGRANPGERGPAVIVGHVDSRDGPGAFWELGDLEPDDRVTVDREDGTSLHWRVDRLEEHPKDDFPTQAVYDDTDEPTLRLITCSGHFDPQERRYRANTIVFLTLDRAQDAIATASAAGAAPAPTDRQGAADPEDAAVVPDAGDGTLHSPASGAVPPAAADPGHLDQRSRELPIALAVASLLIAAGALRRAWRSRG